MRNLILLIRLRGSFMLKKISHFIRANALFTPGETVVVAVSGGADSVALLDILASHRGLGLKLVAAHLNHMLRGAESDGDEEFVRNLAQSHGIPCVVRRVDVKEVARQEGRSLEDAGRSVRYAFLDDVAATHGSLSVALAHHAGDQAETVLMRLLRGAAGSGLCAMAPRSAGRYVRPLLGVGRAEIEEYLKTRGIAWRNDSSNEDGRYLRNRIRHELIPFLAGYNPAISERLCATADALAADEEFLDAATDEAFTRHGVQSPGRVTLSVHGVRSEPRGIRLRLYRRGVLQAKGDLARISFHHLQGIDRLLFSPAPNRSLALPDAIRAEKSYGEISFSSMEEKKLLPPDEIFLDGPGVYPLPGRGVLSVDFAHSPAEPKSVPAATAYFDLEQAPFPWCVRRFRPGDRFSPFGMAGHKKVKNLFIDAKIPLSSRPLVPLIFCGETLLWVGGVRRSSAAPVTERTSTSVRLEIVATP
jgi:tRNA(Ile)-lysidine synthase